MQLMASQGTFVSTTIQDGAALIVSNRTLIRKRLTKVLSILHPGKWYQNPPVTL